MRSMRVPAEIDELQKVLDFVEGELSQQNCPMKVQLQIMIAVEEVFVNIAHYAYGDHPGEAEVACEASPDSPSIWIQFKDNGEPYNPLEKQDPDTSLTADEREIGGLGIFMVKKTMDSMDYAYEGGWNILTLVKKW